MSLVAYQSSSEESEDECKSEVQNSLDHEVTLVKIGTNEPKKRKEPVKITVPAIAEDDEEDEEKGSSKKLKVNSSFGLLSMLPAPKFSATKGKGNLVPYVLTKKKVEPNKKNVSVPVSSHYSQLSDEAKLVSDNSDVSSVQAKTKSTSRNDFFSLQNSDDDEPVSLPSQKPSVFMNLPAPVVSYAANISTISDIPSDLNSEFISHDFSNVPYSQNSPYANQCNTNVLAESSFQNEAATADIEEDIMKDERFLRLQGRKCDVEQISIVDVDVNAQLPSRTEWHTKSLTEEKVSHSRKKNHMPTQMQKRKHQITYLAFQAKEREIDLKNQWAQNRLTKRETQAKYGF